MILEPAERNRSCHHLGMEHARVRCIKLIECEGLGRAVMVFLDHCCGSPAWISLVNCPVLMAKVDCRHNPSSRMGFGSEHGGSRT